MPRDSHQHWCQGHHHEERACALSLRPALAGQAPHQDAGLLIRSLDGPETEALVMDLVEDYTEHARGRVAVACSIAMSSSTGRTRSSASGASERAATWR